MTQTRLKQQFEFIVEIDKLKQIWRQTHLTDGSRPENSAEHSWHIATMALILAEYAPAGVDLLRVIQMLTIHDLVEIDAGDTFCYDLKGNQDKAEREAIAAQRIFGLLPPEQGQQLRDLWAEFEAQQTPNALFAAALDRLQPFLQNLKNQGGTWKQHGITLEQVIQRVEPIQTGAPRLWEFVLESVQTCVEAGYIQQTRESHHSHNSR